MSKFSFKSLTEGNAIIYIAPFLIISSLFHIFDLNPVKHQFGQLELLGAFILTGYYLWAQIPAVYDAQLIGRKRIEAVICMIAGVFSALLLMAPLMTWQYTKLYLASDRFSYKKPIAIAILTLWASTAVFYYSSYTYNKARMTAGTSGLPESSMPTPSSLPSAGQ